MQMRMIRSGHSLAVCTWYFRELTQPYRLPCDQEGLIAAVQSV